MHSLEHTSMHASDAGSAGLFVEQIQEDVLKQLQRGKGRYEPFSQEDIDREIGRPRSPEEKAIEQEKERIRKKIQACAPSFQEGTNETHGSITSEELEDLLRE